VSRSLAGFLVFLLVLIVAGAIGAWYLGPNLVSLAFDEQRRDAPYYLLNFTTGEAADEYPSTYRAGLAELVVNDGGTLLWQARVAQVTEGRMEDEWQNVQLFEFPRGGDCVEMLTSSNYRALVKAHAGVTRMMLGTSTAPDGLAGDQATVFSLMTVDPGQQAGNSANGLLGNLAAYEGVLIWQSDVAELEDRWPWNRVLLLSFPTAAQAESWLRDPATVTERALAATAARRRVTLVLDSSS